MTDVTDLSYDYLFKLLLIGDASVGKSALLLRYADHTFSRTYLSTIGVDFKIRTVTLDNGKRIKLQIWDTSGGERFQSIATSYYRGASGLLIVFDLSDTRSFNNMKYWMNQVDLHTSDSTCIVMVGNKSDLIQQRQVNHADALKFAQHYHAQYIETSAKTGDHVDKAFQQLVEQIYQQRINNNTTIQNDNNKQPFNLSTSQPIDSSSSSYKCCF